MSLTRERAIRYIIAIFLIVSLNFTIPRAMPGDPLTNLLGEDVSLTDSSVQELRISMGLDKPWSQQYLDYWQGILKLDLGYSFHLHSPVSDQIFGPHEMDAFIGWTASGFRCHSGHSTGGTGRLAEQ
jgi:peptide/nickel transport system permease protein